MLAVTGRLESGVITNHLVNWLTPYKERTTVVTGEQGAFVADTLTGDLTFFANGSAPIEWDTIGTFRGVSEGDVTRFAIRKREPLRIEHEAFRDAVLGKANNVVTMTEGLRTLQVVEAALTSAETGQAVRL
jgi:predicted dehydrogenase